MIKRIGLLRGFTVMFLLLLFGVGWWVITSVPFWMEQYTIAVDDTPIVVEVADNPQQHKRGLSGRNGLARGHGMLFLMEESGTPGFWMKDMKFPVDIIWIDEKGIIVDVSPAISPDTYPALYYPKTPVRFVLETESGFIQEHSISIGNRVSLRRAR